jgi:hypothetical protein
MRSVAPGRRPLSNSQIVLTREKNMYAILQFERDSMRILFFFCSPLIVKEFSIQKKNRGRNVRDRKVEMEKIRVAPHPEKKMQAPVLHFPLNDCFSFAQICGVSFVLIDNRFYSIFCFFVGTR